LGGGVAAGAAVTAPLLTAPPVAGIVAMVDKLDGDTAVPGAERVSPAALTPGPTGPGPTVTAGALVDALNGALVDALEGATGARGVGGTGAAVVEPAAPAVRIAARTSVGAAGATVEAGAVPVVVSVVAGVVAGAVPVAVPVVAGIVVAGAVPVVVAVVAGVWPSAPRAAKRLPASPMTIQGLMGSTWVSKPPPGDRLDRTDPAPSTSRLLRRLAPRSRTMAALALGYVGVYLCRKNLAVAVPLLGQAFGANRGEIGRVASFGAAAYAIGKLTLAPLVDRVGGRAGFLAALALVALFGAVGAAAPSLTLLTVAYSANRFTGAAGWPAMMKLVPTWFSDRRGRAVAALSLSYVLGGIAATLLAGAVVAHGGSWRAVMGLPSLPLVAIAIVCAFSVRAGPLASATTSQPVAPVWTTVRVLCARPQFLIVCALSFALTLMRESFNNWSVDFIASIQRPGVHGLGAAALQSTTFDLFGALGILAMGASYDRTPARARRWLIAGVLALLAAVLAFLPAVAARAPASGAWLVGTAGLLAYGPYSLLAGVLAVESGGPAAAATAAGIIDAVGYLASILAGEAFGRLLDAGGYRLGFGCLAGITAAAALCALALHPNQPSGDP
jgi:sugar phosphate permease